MCLAQQSFPELLRRSGSSDVVRPSGPTSLIAIITCAENFSQRVLITDHLRFHDAPAVCCRDQAQERSALGWLEHQVLQQALMCRSDEVFGSHVRFVVGASHLSQVHDLVMNGVSDPQPTNLNVSGLSNARSGTHPDRSRRVRFDADVGGSSHLFVHVLSEDSSRCPRFRSSASPELNART